MYVLKDSERMNSGHPLYLYLINSNFRSREQFLQSNVIAKKIFFQKARVVKNFYLSTYIYIYV